MALRRPPPRAPQNLTRINHRIRVPEVRCIDADGEQIGILPTRDALARAERQGLDLVEVSPTAKPPVCRIMDYGKYKYDQEKKQKAQKKNASATKVKELKFHANVDVHDFETKLRHARDFLGAGNRVKCSLFFRGREGAHQELGFDVMNRVLDELKDIANAEQEPRLMGRSIIMLLTPKPQRQG
jgi:translation initiation factor IF-3